MRIDQFNKVIDEQLVKLGGTVQSSVKPEARGYYVTLYVAGSDCTVSKFYADNAVATYSPQLIRVQITHLYNQLAQSVIDAMLGEGQIYVVR